MIKKILICFLLFNLNQLIRSFNFKVYDEILPGDRTLFIKTPYILFNSNELTSGKEKREQLKCENEDDQIKSISTDEVQNFELATTTESTIESLCTKYNFDEANCTNLNYDKRFIAKWKCEFKYLKNENYSEIVKINEFKLDCEYPDQFNKKFKQYYLYKTCFLRYSLLRIAADPDDHVGNDDNEKENSKHEVDKDFYKIIMLIYMALACIGIFLFCITLNYLFLRLKNCNPNSNGALCLFGFNRVLCCGCNSNQNIGYSSNTKSVLRTSDLNSFKTANFANDQAYMNSGFVLTPIHKKYTGKNVNDLNSNYF